MPTPVEDVRQRWHRSRVGISHGLLAIGLVAAMGMGGGAVWATVSSSVGPSVIHACVNRGGALRIVDDPTKCNSNERPLSWESTAGPAKRWFADRDGDGYGDWYDAMDSAAQPTGYVDNNDDCNDDRADVNPGTGTHSGVGWDFDCDGYANEAGMWWYPDADGDGLGSFEGRLQGSTDGRAPSGTAGWAGDCDDTDATITRECRTENFDYWYRWSEEDRAYVLNPGAGDEDDDGHRSQSEYYTGDLPDDWSQGEPVSGDDCDDYEPRMYAGNTETPYDGLDNDCDDATLDVERYTADVGRHDPDAWGVITP